MRVVNNTIVVFRKSSPSFEIEQVFLVVFRCIQVLNWEAILGNNILANTVIPVLGWLVSSTELASNPKTEVFLNITWP